LNLATHPALWEHVMTSYIRIARNLATGTRQALFSFFEPQLRTLCTAQVNTPNTVPQRCARDGFDSAQRLARSSLGSDFYDREPPRRSGNTGRRARAGRRPVRLQLWLAGVVLASADRLCHATLWLYRRRLVDARFTKATLRAAHRIRAWGFKLAFR
jgi:hypothetical protein